ncbi:GNAT family N-acetyltransferase [Alkalibacter mobilis]|uniref:GNAT family N-acetyltransferase n=1 Tax=Alkalibacter mobilis TaxID=2787712 RepID=UPI00189CBF5B|nr:GNAT family N-acetyltransferase [Alkalibacter mobilis]MBF7097363.1 GNAT family N-acetyltransferase [Alkalibacter mobilis]
MECQIKKCTLKDLFILQDISVSTYYDTFNLTSTKENMQLYLDGAYNTRKLMNELKNPLTEFYLVYFDNEPCGYMKTNEGDAQSDIKDSVSLEIERFYIVKRFHRNKFGTLMMQKVMEIAIQKGKEYVWLGVWENNHKAQRFYKKFGFKVFGKHPFVVGNVEETDLLMKKILIEKNSDLTDSNGEKNDSHSN